VNEANTAEVPLARAGSVGDLSALYHDDYQRFLRVAEAITRDPEEARDAVQEGFSNALRELDRYAGRGSFEGWVWRCVVNAARLARRKSRFRPPVLFREAAAPSEQAGSLLAQIAALPERQRLVLFLRYFADLSYDGIAEAVDVSPGTVAATLNAAHRALRRALEEENDE
jgi:RNA polymerase sigma factor (sigma-70 family)